MIAPTIRAHAAYRESKNTIALIAMTAARPCQNSIAAEGMKPPALECPTECGVTDNAAWMSSSVPKIDNMSGTRLRDPREMGIAHPNPSKAAIPRPVIEIEPAATVCAMIPKTSSTDPIRARRNLWDTVKPYRI